MEETLVHDGPYKNKDFFNFITTSEQPRHQWYYFKEGFSNTLVKHAIDVVSKKKVKLLDPFSGSGTTALTSSLLGHTAIGMEVNPFLHFTSQIKTKAWHVDHDLVSGFDKILQQGKSGKYSRLEGFSTFTKTEENEKWLFNTSVIRRYSGIMSSIDKNTNLELAPLYKFSALIATIGCANVVKDGKGVRYRKDWKRLSFSGSDVEQKMKELFNKVVSDIKTYPIDLKNEPTIILSDSREKLSDPDFMEEDFDLVVTSPPYLNSFDYTDIYRPELFLGGFVNSNEELRNLRLKTLRSHVQVNWDRKVDYNSKYLKNFYDQIVANRDKLWNKNIPAMIEAYFDDLARILANIKPRLRKKGQIWLVVSTSAYAGVHIPVDLIIGELGHELGYRLKGVHCLRYLRTSSQQYTQLQTKTAPLRESLIILEKA